MLLKHNLFFCDQANKSKLKKRIERNVTFLHNKHKSMTVGLTAILVLKKGHARLTSALQLYLCGRLTNDMFCNMI